MGVMLLTLWWRHNGRDSVSNHQPHDCLLKRLFRRRSKKTSKLRVTGLCVENSPGTGEFPAQMANNADNISIWWRHHGQSNRFTNALRWPSGMSFQIFKIQYILPIEINVVHVLTIMLEITLPSNTKIQFSKCLWWKDEPWMFEEGCFNYFIVSSPCTMYSILLDFCPPVVFLPRSQHLFWLET